MAENSRDGLRRHEDLIQEVEAKADEALALVIQGGILSAGAILDIAHGGTGSSTKNFVDLTTNQFNISGSKIFKATCGFQKESDVVNSGEIAGNIRLITCDEQGADIGPQMRYSGRNTDGDFTPFAFATTAGRKENGTSGDKAGYYQISTTRADCTIAEAMRVDSEQNVGIGAIPVLGNGDRLHISGGDILLDDAAGNQMIKLVVGETIGRVQTLKNLDGPLTETEHLLLGINSEFASGSCLLDVMTATFGTAAIDIRASGASATDPGGEIQLLVGDSGECPSLRGRWSIGGLEVIGDAFVSKSVIAGGIANVVGGAGNSVVTGDGFVTAENLKAGVGSPEGVVRAPIGAIYHRLVGGGTDAPDENTTLWVKIFDDGEATGWRTLRTGDEPSICVQTGCPEFATATDGTETPECFVWFDSARSMWWYWDPDIVRSIDPDRRGAWLSADSFQVTSPITGRSHSNQFRRQIDKDYEYITPLKFSRFGLNILLQDMTAAIRVARLSNDPDTNFFTFDLVTLEKRQGEPNSSKVTRQEWPGDRDAFEVRRDNLRGDGHTTHLNLRDDLIALSSLTPNGPAISSTVTAEASGRRILIDTSLAMTVSEFKENDNLNNGFRIRMKTGELAGQERTIRNNTATSFTMRRPWKALTVGGEDKPQVGDEYEVFDATHQKIIARISTQGNVFPDGAHVDPTGDRTADPPPLFAEYATDETGATLTRSQVTSSGAFKTKDVQDFVTSITNGLESNEAGGSPDDETTKFISLDHYIDINGVEDGTDVEPTDAVILAGLWDAVRRPGKISGVISITMKFAMPPAICVEGTGV